MLQPQSQHGRRAGRKGLLGRARVPAAEGAPARPAGHATPDAGQHLAVAAGGGGAQGRRALACAALLPGCGVAAGRRKAGSAALVRRRRSPRSSWRQQEGPGSLLLKK